MMIMTTIALKEPVIFEDTDVNKIANKTSDIAISYMSPDS